MTTPPDLSQQAVDLASEILQAAHQRTTASDRHHMAKMARMMDDPEGKNFTIAFADQVFRPLSPSHAADQLQALLARYGIPAYLSGLERCLLRVGSLAARLVPSVVMPLMMEQVRRESRHMILPGKSSAMHRFLAQRRSSGTRVNLNRLGEAILGEREGRHQLEANLALLADPQVHYISVKISALVSQIHLVAYDQTLTLIQERLRTLYRAAIEHGRSESKFVNLDMEAYRDVHFTLDAFRAVLDEPEFEQLQAGVVLQAYLPDAFTLQRELTQWAMARFNRTGGRIKVRIAKGANLAMERVEAELQGWPQAPYTSKEETDANFKRMVRYGCQPEHAAAVQLGLASHNLFDLAYGLLLREQHDVADQVEFEMLEGMANAQASVVQERAGGLLVYVPVVRREHFKNAIAYLVRRLDENTDPVNFLHDLFGLEPGSPAWNRQRDRFFQSYHRSYDSELRDAPRREQDRSKIVPESTPRESFENEPNTDFNLPHHRRWIGKILDQWRTRSLQKLPLHIGGLEKLGDLLHNASDPSRPSVIAYQYSLGSEADIALALTTAEAAQPSWEQLGFHARREILLQVAKVMRQERGDCIGCMVLDAGKAVIEADVEVSEAIDFAEYYARTFDTSGHLDGSIASALGTVLVTPPWNFPYAIPAGGCLAALMAGNAVILKPAPETVLTAWHLANQLWQAGVPKEILQFLPVPDDHIGKRLVTDDRVKAIVLTGAFATAQMFHRWKPSIRLFAETSGKNSMVITASADLDLAITDLVKSAFGHAGQKCSAVSLALVEAEVYDHPAFRAQLLDAAESLLVGPSWDPASVITPLIRPPGEDLERALTQLDPGEEWLLQPQSLADNPCLWSPGIKLGVQPGGWFHQNECFGPVLGLVRVVDLDEAITVQNATDYGLTGAIHTLDRGQIAYWLERVRVGNAYVNRTSTGAIVRRQPFGGWKHSSIGPGAKAGGPSYVSMFAHWRNARLPKYLATMDQDLTHTVRLLAEQLDDTEERRTLELSARSYLYWWQHEFSHNHDPSQLRCEANQFGYRPRDEVILRVQNNDARLAILQVVMACTMVQSKLRISSASAMPWLDSIPNIARSLEDDASLARYLDHGLAKNCCLRSFTSPVESLRRVTLPIIEGPALCNGRLELPRYLCEQTISMTQHRHGNVIKDSEVLTRT